MLSGIFRPLVRAWNRYPMVSGLLIGGALVAAVLAFAPSYIFLLSDLWMFVILGVLTMIVAVAARARSGDEDEW